MSHGAPVKDHGLKITWGMFLFPLDMDRSKVTQIFGDGDYRFKMYIPEDLDNIKPLLPSLASKCVASKYVQYPKNVFQPLAFGPQYMKQILKGKS